MKDMIRVPRGSPDRLNLLRASEDAARQDHVLAQAQLASRHRVARGSATAAAMLFGMLAGFQMALALGLPWGEAAWGGAHAELRVGLRVASGVQAVVATGFALIVLRRAGHGVWAPLPQRWLSIATRILAGYMALGTLVNAASQSSIERALWTPVALSLTVLCGLVAVWSPKIAAGHEDTSEQ